MTAPLALLVEDSPLQREERSAALRDAGFLVIQAKDGSSALTQLRNSPQPDIVVSDVNLVEGKSTDRSGREFAQLVARELVETKVVVYSAQDNIQQSLQPSGESEQTIDFVAKGEIEDNFEAQAAAWFQHCVTQKATRLDRVGSGHAAAKNFARAADETGDIALLRDFVPHDATVTTPDWHAPVTPERILKDAGYTLKVVDGSIYSDITDAYSPKNVQHPFLIWLYQNDEDIFAQLYKFPGVTSYARSEIEVTKGILREMRKIKRNFDRRTSELGPHESQLNEFLNYVLVGS